MPPSPPVAAARHLLLAVLVAAALVLGLAPVSGAAGSRGIEDYASYQPGTECRPEPKRGAVFLGEWLVDRYGGTFGGVGRACSASTSEHEEGRAFDWTLDATEKADRRRAARFLRRIRATDDAGNTDAWARRMGVMYVIWNDTMWSAWDRFEPEPYLSSGCPSRQRCSATLRHRDHLHVSLTRDGGRGATSWFTARM